MGDVSTTGAKAIAGSFRKHLVWGLIILAGVFILAMSQKDRIVGWFTSPGSTVRGDRLPAFLRKLIAPVAVVVGVLLFSGDALAATCCAVTDYAPGPGLWEVVTNYWQYIVGGGAPLVLGLTGLGSPDTLDCEEEHGGHGLAVAGPLAATLPQSLYVKSATHSTWNDGKCPLVATDLTAEVACTITNPGAVDLDDQDFARVLAYLEIVSPKLGNLTDQTSCTGPILDLVTSFLGNGFERAGDAPVLTVAAGGGPTAITKYFTRPFALRFLDRPLSSAPWLGLLHNTRINFGLAADTCLAGISVGATVTLRTIRASVSYQPIPDWFYPWIGYDRVDAPASGSNGMVFKNFGAPGAVCTEKIDYVHTIGHLSSLKGLGGNLTFDTLTQLLAPRFGLDDIQIIPHLVKARIRAQYEGAINGVHYVSSGNYSSAAVDGPNMNVANLLFFFLQQPELGMGIRGMRRMDANQELPVQYVTSVPRVGADQFYFGSLRRIDQGFIKNFRDLPGNRMPSSVGRVRDGVTGLER